MESRPTRNPERTNDKQHNQIGIKEGWQEDRASTLGDYRDNINQKEEKSCIENIIE